MIVTKIISEISKSLAEDTGYRLFAPAAPLMRLDYIITFDLSNTPDELFFAPYFEVLSLADTKEIVKEVLETECGEAILDFEEKFNKILLTKDVDWNKKTYLCV